MAESYLFNQRRILPCAVHLNGEYGYSDVYAGVPAIIGGKGVEKVLELSLEKAEKDQFDASVQSVRGLIEDVTRLGL
jgi:malate dehydrogenase